MPDSPGPKSGFNCNRYSRPNWIGTCLPWKHHGKSRSACAMFGFGCPNIMNFHPSFPPLLKGTATNTESAAEVLIAILMGGSSYYMIQQLDPSNNYAFLSPLIVGFVMGSFGVCTVFLTGPATMLGLLIWSPLDFLFFHAFDCPSWPSVMPWYGFLALVGLAGAVTGRALRPWWGKNE